ncbi:1-deoxy-D-xylulose 5-phosphate reductoisomerase [Fontimonas thermophila]|uniref:1-deoxy-D-xylulose 5-phosphate reductoisomerase n=1 Tax=Fontimonas thermophila TaxID=1076937 RepID=A0A1I2HKX3_9GAMM|nr:1-deoxy-D-xylulose-5-phosphate reductoisomerase [Fontimonas thermophila]SFF29940.1 1-deoxy-D-xylulose 5-phosphate reductoisomerase [Fontimonas thermophila]
MQGLVVLGATGTIGRNTLDVVRRNAQRIKVCALTAHRDVQGMLELCAEFRPLFAVLSDPAAARALQAQLAQSGLPTRVLAGPDALAEVASLPEAEQVMCAIVGAAGLLPTLSAVRAGKRVLIANKEPLVMAGSLLLAEAARCGATLIPIDSEHNAIFQCLPAGSRCGHAPAGVRRLILTASGGPFRETPLEALDKVTPAQAVRHPNWVMGPKISVDSATMMNKGLELIEASVLYALPGAQIDVVIHPESAVHSIVEYLDGSMLAQLGASDMRVPIAHALAWPERWQSGVGGLDLATVGRLRFESPDLQRFPCLGLARAALEAGGNAPNVLNAANEVAVQAFLDGRLSYTGIARVIEKTLEASAATPAGSGDLESILAIDAWARAKAGEWIHA